MKSLHRFWKRLQESRLRRRRHALTVSHLQDLDPRALRDLGLDRSEIPSVAAEAAGLVGRDRLQPFQSFP